MNKKIVVLFSSPNETGFTAHALNSALSGISSHNDITMLNCYDLRISPCIGCNNCDDGLCKFNKFDAMEHILAELSKADVVILASPIYFFGFPMPLKAVIDRMQQFFSNKENRKLLFEKPKKGFLLLTSGSPDNAYNGGLYTTAKFIFSFINAEFVDKLLISSTDKLDLKTADFNDMTKAFSQEIKEAV